jgi:hypothetical protein
LPRKDREGDACHFIGKCDGNKLEGLGLHELLRPGTQCVFVRDTAQPLLAASIALIVSIIM